MPRPSKPKSVRYATLKKKVQAESETTKYYTTYKDIKKWFKYINDVVFDGKLAPFNDIVIKDLRRQNVMDKLLNGSGVERELACSI